ncbi:uncharacterized protein LOC100888319 [Strongylocentrotus purpuratus]|uniref:Disease resistance R13L4/SHOC-2-like LRR domain-containing protein n=1 Tax=Strongylocentrotus purpuratus TaxID=7668 RepID=A0A7M7GJB2_STRPU|nr:uncharacterized protein LOC100888319 [Strongylocentrotus purpuratus]|eukprot:XP_003730245.1 PREDICTED: uncharacterized protein LOC100888319 [Strongylocentrotus purpuratus]
MGNVQLQVNDFTPVRPDERRELKLTRKITSADYQKHVAGEDLEGALTELPWALVDSISLFEHMDASFNHISVIPPEIPLRLPHLSYLNMAHNRIPALPDSFSLLFHLKTLLIHHNELEHLPDSFIHLVKLEKLDVSSNKLKSLPENIGVMESLHKLNVMDNSLTLLPLSLGKSGTIEVLLASNNKCASPPQSVCDEGSEKTLQFLRKQSENGYILKKSNSGNIFKRCRGDVLQSRVANPQCAQAQYAQELTETTNTKSRIRTPLRPPPGATTLEADELMDKVVGLLYGAAIGDAVGLCTAWMTQDECRFHYEEDTLHPGQRISDKHRLQWAKGDWTTAFDQLVLTLDSILQWAGVVDELDFAKRLAHWYNHGFPELGDTKGFEGFSNTVAKVIANPLFCQEPSAIARGLWNRNYDCHDSDSCEHLADNCAVVRTAILGVPHFYRLEEVEENALRICTSTHQDPRCQASCAFLSSLVALILQKDCNSSSSEDLSLEKIITVATEIGRKHLIHDEHQQMFKKYCSVSSIDSLTSLDVNKPSHTFRPVATCLAALRMSSTSNFRSLITQIAMQGGDSTHNASVAGAVLGCWFGFKNLPPSWVRCFKKSHTAWLDVKINALLDMMGLP